MTHIVQMPITVMRYRCGIVNQQPFVYVYATVSVALVVCHP